MNIDFHYYGTYTAARLAGFKKDDAVLIAYSAQFVDEFKSDYCKELDNDRVVRMPTTMSFFSTATGSKVQKAWMPFHFLPSITGEYASSLGENTLPDSNQYKLGLLCSPNSKMAKLMIYKALMRNRDGLTSQKERLIRIGMVIHIFADTYAHANFCGYATRELNGVKQKSFIKGVPEIIEDFEVGHGRLGHSPDEAGYTYSYMPAWFTEQICISNPIKFSKAYDEMAENLYILNNRQDRHRQFGNAKLILKDPDSEFSFSSDKMSDIDKWKGLIKKFDLGEPPVFDKNLWCNEYDSASRGERGQSNLAIFNNLAHQHYTMVSTYIDPNIDYNNITADKIKVDAFNRDFREVNLDV